MNVPVRKGTLHSAGANFLPRKFKLSGWKTFIFVLYSNILSPNACKILTAELCSFRSFKPQPVTSAILLLCHHHSWGPSLQMAQPGPPPAVEACAITPSLLSLSVLAKLQLTQTDHISALLCTHVSRICYLKQTLAQQCGMTAVSGKCRMEPAAQSSLLPLLLCNFSVQTWEFISANFHQEPRNLHFSSHIEEKVTE